MECVNIAKNKLGVDNLFISWYKDMMQSYSKILVRSEWILEIKVFTFACWH